jgi:hypothetical protein
MGLCGGGGALCGEREESSSALSLRVRLSASADCRRGVYSVKKLMKQILLAQYDVEGRVVHEYKYGGRPLARADFYIWSFGPMSNEVYDALESEDFDLVQGSLVLRYAMWAPCLSCPGRWRLGSPTWRRSTAAGGPGNWSGM